MRTCEAAPLSWKNQAYQSSIPFSIFILLIIIQPFLIIVKWNHAVRQLPFLLPTLCEKAKL